MDAETIKANLTILAAWRSDGSPFCDSRRDVLSEANLSGENLSGANLSEANLSGANLIGADLSRAVDGSLCRMDFGKWSI